MIFCAILFPMEQAKAQLVLNNHIDLNVDISIQ